MKTPCGEQGFTFKYKERFKMSRGKTKTYKNLKENTLQYLLLID